MYKQNGAIDITLSFIINYSSIFNMEFQLLAEAKYIWAKAITVFWKLSKISCSFEEYYV